MALGFAGNWTSQATAEPGGTQEVERIELSDEGRETITVGFYRGDSSFQNGFSDSARKTGYAYDYLQELAPYANWNYEYEYMTRSEAIDALERGEIDLVAGVYKTERLEGELLFSDFSMGLEGEPRYFAVNKNRPDLLATLNQANAAMIANNPKFQLENWQKYYGQNNVVTSLTNEEYAWLTEKGSLKLGYLTSNPPISSQDDEGNPEGVIGAVIPVLEEHLRIPIEPVGFNGRVEMANALITGEVDVIFPVYSDLSTSESSDMYQTDPLLEDRIMIAYTGEYSDSIFSRVALSKAAIAQQTYMEEYYPNSELLAYSTRGGAFEAVLQGEATSTIGSASVMQLFMAENSDYSNFNTAYLDTSEGFSFAVARNNAMLAVIMQDTVAQIDDSLVTNAMIRSSYARTPFSLLDVLREFSLELFVTGVLIIATIIIVFIQYRRRVKEFNKEQADTRAALEEALRVADNASAAKTDFLSSMSHDIRTPLNAVIGMTAIAAANIDDKNRVMDCLSKISSSGQHLLALINEILDVSKIESGRIELSEEEFNLSDMLYDLININKPQADAKRQHLYARAIDVVHEDVIGDRTRLQQVFTNLVSNAIKYTQVGGQIDITLVEKSKKGGTFAHFEFIVKDNGKGMSPEYLPHLFEAFSREDDKKVAKEQGTGLGMAIALSIARMMNGDITVESEVGKGSMFTVTVFLRVAEGKRDEREFEDLRVLMVDDDEDVCESTALILADMGMQCHYLTSGREAVEHLAQVNGTEDDYFVAIIDWIMPEMDGIETIRAIRERVGEEIPIIVISAYDWSEIEDEAREAGASYFVSKPLFKSHLSQLFSQIVGGDADGAAACELGSCGASGAGSRGLIHSADQVDFSGKRALLAEDNELNAEVVTAFMAMTGLEIEHASNGQEALDMVKSHEPGYYDCVFMDMQMPEMDGLEATRAIRALEREDTDFEQLPIFAMTANAFVDDVRKTSAAGMNDHFAKPLDFKVVLATVDKYLNK
ncbi:response regulator [Anaerotardibacter muris]|uniref:response regulator n=1 Tax=Anaerotardibacter muris TaxID=2941505 RepID=UPI0020409BC8|nr:response regulator [Anaerotardibacter muris]